MDNWLKNKENEMNIYRQTTYADNLWNIKGSFGEFDANVTVDDGSFYAENGIIEVRSEIIKHDNGVCVRKGTVKNISDNTVILNTISSKFTSDGGEYEVYSQSNCWQNESEGGWQPLVTSVSSVSKSVRNASGAAPFMVLWSAQHNRGIAFHLSAYSSWEMRISRVFCAGEVTVIETELGVYNENFELKLEAGEVFELPEIIYYEVLNRIDLDCWKLHSYLNNTYPRKSLPVIYNSWLYKFDRFTYDDIKKQIEKAKELGIEYFVIDAGWFGEGNRWWSARGDWEENQSFGFKGRMCEIAQEVRQNGMKFGFWLEPECASESSDIVEKHPDYFLKGKNSYFIDFANESAANYIFDKTCQLIDRLGAEFVKFDFNADLYFDKYNTSFVNYFKGHRNFIAKLKEKYPDLYMENCGSGGMRMSVRDGEFYDGFWPTDNQSPYYSLRIFKDTILRVPPQWLEGWISVRTAENFYYALGTDDLSEKIFSTNDATWSNVVGVDFDYLSGFMKGRSISLSFDLTLLSDTVFNKLKNYISSFKEERDFWQNAVCHILCDTKTMLILEYRNTDCSRIELVAFSGKIKQDNVCIYPVCDVAANYNVDGEGAKSGAQLKENGIDIPLTVPHTAQIVKLNKLIEDK